MCEEIHMETEKFVLNIHKSMNISALHETLSFFHDLIQMVGRYYILYFEVYV